MLSWRTVRVALPVLLGAQLLASCSDGHKCGSHDWHQHNPPASDAGPGAQDAAGDAAGNDAAVRLSNAELMAYLTVVNEQQLALTSYAMTRVRVSKTIGLGSELWSVHNRARARQKWFAITPAESAASASLRSMFVQARTELEAASADLVDERFADAEVRLLREIVMALETVLGSRGTHPDLTEEVNRLDDELTDSLYSAMTVRSWLRENGSDASVNSFDAGTGYDAGYSYDAAGYVYDAGHVYDAGYVYDAGNVSVPDAATSDAGT